MRSFPILLGLALATSVWGSEASKLYSQARKAEKAGQIARAYLLYSEAAALEPENHLYWSRSLALQTRAALESKLKPQELSAAALAGETPQQEEPALQAATAQDLAEARKPLAPSKLDAEPLRKDFNLRANAKSLFESVAHAYGLDCVFDGDYHATETIRFEMDQVDYREALHALEAVTGSFVVPISARLFLVVKDTPQKRREEEPYAAVTIRVPEVTTQQELTNMITAVQQACGIQKVAWDSHTSTVMMRDAVAKVLPARQLFEDLMYPRAQVLLEMDFIEVTNSSQLNYGLPLQNSFPLASFSTFMHNVPQLASNVTNMLRFGGGAGLIGVGIANMQLLASLTRSDSKILLHATARSVNGQAATIHVGQKYPIETAGYFGPASFSGPGAYQPPPSFTFEDLGLSLKATPHVHGTDEVTLSLEAEFKVLAGTALNGIPVISNRSLKSDVTLKMGESALVAGLIDDEDARTLAGIAGFARIPIIGPLTSNNTHNQSSDRVVILLRPTLLTPPPDESLAHVFRMGTETRPLSEF
ncbi:MAG TPA: type II and III secretion system protein [Bryobacteraceae bacterium]|nr:type II and III secretion system protein [Bryobacteraceae bacterium]